LILVVVVKTVLTNAMSATDGLLTAMLVAVGVAIICNYKRLKGHIIQDFTTGFWTSVNTLLVTGGIMGFAAVMKGAPGFAPFLAAAQWMDYRKERLGTGRPVANILVSSNEVPNQGG
jgi:H+/gluconate symporter-like permease